MIWSIERLAATHDRSQFNCGEPSLDSWLQTLASQYEKRDLARVYVAVEVGETLVLGYYALSAHRVEYQAISPDQSKGLPKIDVPVALIGRLAVDRSTQVQGLGEYLLMDALSRIVHVADEIGIRAVEVDALTEAAKRFYLQYGFTSLADDERHLYLPVTTIRKLKLPPPS